MDLTTRLNAITSVNHIIHGTANITDIILQIHVRYVSMEITKPRNAEGIQVELMHLQPCLSKIRVQYMKQRHCLLFKSHKQQEICTGTTET